MLVKLERDVEIIDDFFSVSVKIYIAPIGFELYLQTLGTFKHLYRQCSDWLSKNSTLHTFYEGKFKTVSDLYSNNTSLLTYLHSEGLITLTEKQEKNIKRHLAKANKVLLIEKDKREKRENNNRFVIQRAISRKKEKENFNV